MAVVAGWASLAQAADPSQPGPPPPLEGARVTSPAWIRRPYANDLARAWPAKAAQDGVGGSAKILCYVTLQGLLDRCKVIEESPKGEGFGGAALMMSRYFAMRPATVKGVPVEGMTVVIPLRFETPGAPMGASARATQLLVSPVWSNTPTPAQIAEAFPAGQAGKNNFGHLVLRCAFAADGSLHDCSAIAENPPGAGFARAAMKLAKDFKVDPATYGDVKLANFSVEVPIAFVAPGMAAPVAITDPQWVRTVSSTTVQALYPTEAASAGVKSGRGVVECIIDHAGDLTQCRAVAEAPPGLGFGDAAVRIASAMGLNSWTPQGRPVDSDRIRLPVVLNLAPTEAPPAPTAARAAPSVVSNPDWSQAVGPGAAELMEVYPERAHRKGLSGAAKIKCVVTVEGTLDQCAVVEETPPDEGFGKAALRLSPYFRFHPRIVDGVPTGGATVVIPIRFDLPLDAGSDATHLLNAPVWASQATPGQIAAAFPRDRLATTDEEHVTLQCRVLADGSMGRCTTTEDDPSFRAAAQSLAKYYRVDVAASEEQLPDETYVDLHIQFKASAVTAR